MRTLTKLNSRGSLHLGILAVVVALAIVGFVGYKVATNNSKSTNTASTSQQTKTEPSGYTSSEEVAKDDDSLNTSDVDQELNTTQLDSDINNLL